MTVTILITHNAMVTILSMVSPVILTQPLAASVKDQQSSVTLKLGVQVRRKIGFRGREKRGKDAYLKTYLS